MVGAWLADGLGAGVFTALARYDDRVKWGTETRPDEETWGMDAATQEAMAAMERSLQVPDA